MLLSEINIYPIKSLGGIKVDRATVEHRGLAFDRRLMLVDDENRFITQREYPKMAAVSVTVEEVGLSVTAPECGVLDIPREVENGSVTTVKIWSSRVRAHVYDAKVNNWFSQVLGVSCRLALMPDSSRRIVNPFYAVRRFEDELSFADGYPFLLITEASLADLNGRLKSAVPMDRFRPNFVISGAKPFAEDNWRLIKIGKVEFHVVKPCARCSITTVDQAAGISKGPEPLRTLATYRKRNGKILFGQNLIAESAGGTVAIGDRVEVLEARR